VKVGVAPPPSPVLSEAGVPEELLEQAGVAATNRNKARYPVRIIKAPS
jgi:hypothetical protein